MDSAAVDSAAVDTDAVDMQWGQPTETPGSSHAPPLDQTRAGSVDRAQDDAAASGSLGKWALIVLGVLFAAVFAVLLSTRIDTGALLERFNPGDSRAARTDPDEGG